MTIVTTTLSLTLAMLLQFAEVSQSAEIEAGYNA